MSPYSSSTPVGIDPSTITMRPLPELDMAVSDVRCRIIGEDDAAVDLTLTHGSSGRSVTVRCAWSGPLVTVGDFPGREGDSGLLVALVFLAGDDEPDSNAVAEFEQWAESQARSAMRHVLRVGWRLMITQEWSVAS